jgi:hypothetical protein
MESTRTHLDAGADDLVESSGRFLFNLPHLDWREGNLVRSRLNLNGEGHESREAALAHLESVRELEINLRRLLNP